MIEDKAADSVDVCFFGADAIMAEPDSFAHLVEETWLRHIKEPP